MRQLRRYERLQLISFAAVVWGEGDPVTSDTGSPFFVMELIFLLCRCHHRFALGCWLFMRARFFEPLRAETERRARAEALASRLPELETRVSELQIVNTDLQAEKRVLAEAQARLLESFRALSAQALQANNQMFLDLADTALAKRPDGHRRTRTAAEGLFDEGRLEDSGTRNGSCVCVFDAVHPNCSLSGRRRPIWLRLYVLPIRAVNGARCNCVGLSRWPGWWITAISAFSRPSMVKTAAYDRT